MEANIPGMHIAVVGTRREGDRYVMDVEMRVVNRLRLLLWAVRKKYNVKWWQWPKVLYIVLKIWARWRFRGDAIDGG